MPNPFLRREIPLYYVGRLPVLCPRKPLCFRNAYIKIRRRDTRIPHDYSPVSKYDCREKFMEFNREPGNILLCRQLSRKMNRDGPPCQLVNPIW